LNNTKAVLPPRDAEAILFGLKFANDIDIHYNLRCSQPSIEPGFRAPNILAHCVVRCGVGPVVKVKILRWGTVPAHLGLCQCMWAPC